MYVHPLVITQILLPKETALSISIPFCEWRASDILILLAIKESLENDDGNKMTDGLKCGRIART